MALLRILRSNKTKKNWEKSKIRLMPTKCVSGILYYQNQSGDRVNS